MLSEANGLDLIGLKPMQKEVSASEDGVVSA